MFITLFGNFRKGVLALQCSCVLTRPPAVSKVLMMLNLDGSLAAELCLLLRLAAGRCTSHGDQRSALYWSGDLDVLRVRKGAKSQKGRRATLPRDQPDQPDQPDQAGDPGWPWMMLEGDRAQGSETDSHLPWQIPAVEGSTPNRIRQLHHGRANGRPRNDAEDI